MSMCPKAADRATVRVPPTEDRMRRPSFFRRLSKVLLCLNILVLIGCAAAVGVFAGAISAVRQVLPDTTELATYRPRFTTILYSTEQGAGDGERHTLLGKVVTEGEDRIPVDFRDIPERLVQATVAIEDRRFWLHRGVSPRDMARALLANLRQRNYASQGASTITQQLARNIFLSPEKTVDRKLKEALLAIEIERKFSKEEILEMYLNQVYYGHGAYGVAAAASTYYGKKADELDELTLAQCAMLAGLPQRPATYSPYNHPRRAKARRDMVLDWMARCGYITAREAVQAKRENLQKSLAPRRERKTFNYKAPYFTTYAIRLLSRELGHEAVFGGGLRVYTTLDMRLQEAAEEAVTRGVRKLESKKVDQGALVCMDVHTGRVLALVGGVGEFREHQWNRAVQAKRQPGSSFKPYVYTAALQRGWRPTSLISGNPLTVQLVGGRTHTFHNAGPKQDGLFSLTTALAKSINPAAVRMMREVGIEPVVATASRMMGVPPSPRFDGHHGLALALGTVSVSPLEMATGYSAFANGGFRPEPRFVDRVTDSRGVLVYESRPRLTRVIDKNTAAQMVQMMTAVVRGGTGWRARLQGVECAGKTGTTDDYKDAWFIGYTPDICTAVWVGRDDNKKPGGRLYGGTAAAPIWKDFMSKAVGIRPTKHKFPRPDGSAAAVVQRPTRTYTICVDSGDLATRYCPVTEERRFGPGDAPTTKCRLHGPSHTQATDSAAPGPSPPERTIQVTICVESGKRATPYCPDTAVAEFPLGKAPSRRCSLHGPLEDAP